MTEKRKNIISVVGIILLVFIFVFGFGALICTLNPKECQVSCIDYEEMKK